MGEVNSEREGGGGVSVTTGLITHVKERGPFSSEPRLDSKGFPIGG